MLNVKKKLFTLSTESRKEIEWNSQIVRDLMFKIKKTSHKYDSKDFYRVYIFANKSWHVKSDMIEKFHTNDRTSN